MEKEFNLKKERKMIPKIINITNAVAYHTGVKNCLEIVREQDKEFIEKFKKWASSGTRIIDRESVCKKLNELAGKDEQKE